MSRKRNRLWHFISLLLILAVAGLLVICLGSMYVYPVRRWYLTVLGLGFLPLFAVNLILLIWTVACHRRSAIFPLLALIPSCFFIGNYVQLGLFQPEGEPQLKILTYNVGGFHYGDSLSADACMDSVFSFIESVNPDIVCIQEYPEVTKRLPALQERFPDYDIQYYTHTSDSYSHGNVTMSRLVAVDKGKFDFDESSNLALYCDYELRGVRFRVYNCHLESYSIPIVTLSDVNESAVHQTGRSLRKSLMKRPYQVDKIVSDRENAPSESFVVGDFNDTPMSYTYHQLREGRRDSFVEAGKGLGYSYSHFRPFLRIDHILHTPGFRGVRHEVLYDVCYSDHYPVTASFAVK